MRGLRFLLLFSLAMLLAACSQPAAQPGPDSTAPAAQPGATAPAPGATAPSGAYPAPGSGAYPAPGSGGSAYPGPTAATTEYSMEPIVVPQPSSGDVGVATGTLLRIDGQGQQVPIPGAVVYLGVVQQDPNGRDAMVALDRNVAPRTVTNGLGQFVFTDVPPGRYGLMYESLQGALLLNKPQDNTDMVIEIVGGQVFELGELAYALQDPN